MMGRVDRNVEIKHAQRAGTDASADTQLARENEGLRVALDRLVQKFADQEVDFKDALARSSAWGAMQEERAEQAVSRLETIENSLSWRAIARINGNLDRYPRLRVFIKRSLKLVLWTATGRLPSKVKQFRTARRVAAVSNGSMNSHGESLAPTQRGEDVASFFVSQTTLPNSLLDTILSFVAKEGPVGLVMAINFYAGGGAESVALDYARAYAEKGGRSVLLVLTDNGPERQMPPIPGNILVLDLRAYASNSTDREDYLFLILRMVSPSTFHIINSVVAFTLLKQIPLAFLKNINIVTSVFSLQYDPSNDTKLVGYGKRFLPENIDKIDCVVTDNRCFSIEGPLKLGLVDSAHKFTVVYNKSKLDDSLSINSSLKLLSKRLLKDQSASRFKVIWAGRLDSDKRPDLLAEIAALTEEFCDFLVFGGSVIDGSYETLLKQRSNVYLCGPYREPVEWDRAGTGNAFLFTSRTEGMPNTLIEAAYLGYPVVASVVGGVGELIHSETGWPIEKTASASAYADALGAIFRNQTEAGKKTRKLIELAHSRHDERSYLDALAEVPGYERA